MHQFCYPVCHVVREEVVDEINGPRHLSGIPDLKMATHPSTMIRTQADHQRRCL
jgi:hypothetical protein